jgi:hypothetical protein
MSTGSCAPDAICPFLFGRTNIVHVLNPSIHPAWTQSLLWSLQLPGHILWIYCTGWRLSLFISSLTLGGRGTDSHPRQRSWAFSFFWCEIVGCKQLTTVAGSHAQGAIDGRDFRRTSHGDNLLRECPFCFNHQKWHETMHR